MNSSDAVAELIEHFPRIFRGQPPLGHSFLPDGWRKLVTQLFDDIDRMLDGKAASQFEVRQIKEKKGRLRVRVWLGPPYVVDEEMSKRESHGLLQRIWARISSAEDESERTCESCGHVIAARQRSDPVRIKCESCGAECLRAADFFV